MFKNKNGHTTSSISIKKWITVYALSLIPLLAFSNQDDGRFMPPVIFLLFDDDSQLKQKKYYLNDTGFFYAGLLSGSGTAPNNSCPTDVSYEPQDCHFGRDNIQPSPIDGRNGFSFTKLDANGDELSAGATSARCIKDNVTGLIWELKTDDGGLHDKDNAYYWYSSNSSNNGGSVGQIGEGGLLDEGANICSGYSAGIPATFCNTEAFVNRVNNQQLCGISNWKLPPREQLRSLVDYSVSSPVSQPVAMLDDFYFPNTLTTNRVTYWTSTPRAGATFDKSWAVSFKTGEAIVLGRHQSSLVRLVSEKVGE